MTVKDVLMSLVYDGIVDTDKIGTSVYFWAFPSKAGQNVSLHMCTCQRFSGERRSMSFKVQSVRLNRAFEGCNKL